MVVFTTRVVYNKPDDKLEGTVMRIGVKSAVEVLKRTPKRASARLNIIEKMNK